VNCHSELMEPHSDLETGHCYDIAKLAVRWTKVHVCVSDDDDNNFSFLFNQPISRDNYYYQTIEDWL